MTEKPFRPNQETFFTETNKKTGRWYSEVPHRQRPEITGGKFGKVVQRHLPIFAGYQLLLAVLIQMGGQGGFIILDMVPLILHWVVLVILGIVSFANSKKGAGFGYLISFFITAIVGFGSCWWISGMVDSHFNL